MLMGVWLGSGVSVARRVGAGKGVGAAGGVYVALCGRVSGAGAGKFASGWHAVSHKKAKGASRSAIFHSMGLLYAIRFAQMTCPWLRFKN